MSASTVVSALAASLRRDPGRPLVTFYDCDTGERIELSVVTFTNWVNKIANLFTDELSIDPGDTVRVRLPTHWQSGVTILGAWTAGLVVDLGDANTIGPDVAASVVGSDALAAPSLVLGQPLACSLRPMGGRFVDPLPAGWLDFALEVPPQPDAFLGVPGGLGDDLAVRTAAATMTHTDLADRGGQTAAEIGLQPGGRLVTDHNPSEPEGIWTALVAPLMVDASVVLVANGDTQQRAAISDQERATVRLLDNG